MSLIKRALWGIGQFSWYVLGACILAAIGYAADSDALHQRGYPSLMRAALFYATAGVVGGIALGLLRPLSRTTAGTALWGFSTALPVSLVILFLSPFPPRIDIDAVSVAIAVGMSAVLGPAVAAYFVSRSGRSRSKQSMPNEELKPTATPSSLVE